MINIEVIHIEKEFDGKRLDAVLAGFGAYKSRSLAAKYCDQSRVKVNGKPQVKKYKVTEGDTIEYVPAPESLGMQGQDIPLDIRYEDEHIIVLSKQPGLVCHPATGHESDTLVNALIAHCGKDHLCNIQNDDTRLGIVHRLDADTSGLMIVAKTDQAGHKLSQDMRDYVTSRHYLALVFGNVKQNTGKIIAPLMRVVSGRPKMAVRDDDAAKDSITTFESKVRFIVSDKTPANKAKLYNPGATLLDCKIHTGRTHQIRAHMEFINHPVLGDPIYDAGLKEPAAMAKDLGLKRQFLHSYKIGFNHPITGERMQFEDSLPKDLANVLEKVKKYATVQ